MRKIVFLIMLILVLSTAEVLASGGGDVGGPHGHSLDSFPKRLMETRDTTIKR
jgi:hypothetical protein